MPVTVVVFECNRIRLAVYGFAMIVILNASFKLLNTLCCYFNNGIMNLMMLDNRLVFIFYLKAHLFVAPFCFSSSYLMRLYIL